MSWRIELQMDPAELRKKNFIQPEHFPYTSAWAGSMTAATTGRPCNLAMDKIGYAELRQEQAEKRQRGELMGIGISSFTEIVGAGPSKHFDILGIKMFDSARSASIPQARSLRASVPRSRGRGTRRPTRRSSPRSSAFR